ncbi:MAG: MFS transporter [Bacteroidales bacterium]|nr:MFS transporter [Bacteroidales bacterium]MBN2821524.1 MFS transporter [Bacteroidales bacterium]
MRNNKTWYKFPVLFSLYIAQSVPMSFFSTVVPVIMRQENYSLESIGLLQLMKLPWILKFIWAPFVDNKSQDHKQIRKWIVMSELFYAAIIIGIGFFNLQTNFKMILVLLVIAFIASATQDIATDKFAIAILHKRERSLGNSMQSAGSFIGSLLGTGVLLLAYYYFGWQNLLFILAVFVLFAIVPLFFFKPEIQSQSVDKNRVKIQDIFLFFKDKRCSKRLWVLLFYYSGIIGVLAMLKPYLVDLGYNVKQIGFMSGIVGTSVAAGASFLSGLIIKTIGRKTSIYLFAFINVTVGVYFYFLSGITPSINQIYIGICLVWGAYGLSSVVIYTTSMDMVRKNRKGTDFTTQIVITHLSGMIIAILSGHLGTRIGYNGMFLAEIVLALIAILTLLYNYPIKIFKRHADK